MPSGKSKNEKRDDSIEGVNAQFQSGRNQMPTDEVRVMLDIELVLAKCQLRNWWK